MNHFLKNKRLGAYCETTGVSQEPHLAEIWYEIPASGSNNVCKSKRLGAYARADRREPGAKAHRNLEIEIPASGTNHF